MLESVYCLGCGAEFDGDTDPYPLSNGMCAKCIREARRPVASILAENERLRAENARLKERLALIGGRTHPMDLDPPARWPRTSK